MAKLYGAAAARRPIGTGTSGSQGTPAWTGIQLLVVEDDEHVARALESVLRRHGFEVVMARTGREALAALNSETDLVLLDLALPDIDGFEVCQEIRRRTDTPVIMATARSGVASRVRGLELGADDYVTKPYDLREVLARIRTVLRRRPEGEHSVLARPRGLPDQLRPARGPPGRQHRGPADPQGVRPARAARAAPWHRGLPERILHEVWGTTWKGLERSL